MGIVYLASAPDGNQVALKVMRPEWAAREDFRRRFRKEVQAAKRVARFCTAPLLDADLDGEVAYLVTEYVDGPDLASVVDAQGPMDGGNLEALAVGVAAALTAIHGADVVHRDLKPSNILLSPVGPRVIDFGIAQLADTLGTQTETVIGTPSYMAPEHAGGETIGRAADVFAWGSVITYAGTGHPPFGSGGGSEVLYRVVNHTPKLDGLDERLRPLVERALDKDPARRPTAQQLLDRLVGGEKVEIAAATQIVSKVWTTTLPQDPTKVSPPARKWRRVPSIAAGLAVVVAAGIVAAGIVLAVQHSWFGPAPGTLASQLSKPKEEAGWRLTKSDLRMIIPPPSAEGDSFADCVGAPSTFVNLDKMMVTTDSNHGNMESDGQTLEYMNCGKDGTAGGSGLKLRDNQGVMGSVDRSDVTPTECRDAARQANLSNPIPIKRIQDDTVLKRGMGICVETSNKNVVLLWIMRVDNQPDNHNLRTYVTAATQWSPEASGN
jgi:serine/threonine protein kinase